MSDSLSSLSCNYALRRHALDRPGQVAIIDGLSGARITYGELLPQVTRIAGWLAAQGVSEGDRFACLALNGKDYAEFHLALSWLGAVLVPLNIRHAPAELRFILDNAGARGIFTDTQLLPLAQAALGSDCAIDIRILAGAEAAGWTPFAHLSDSQHSTPENPALTGDTLHMLLYTSGTTGKPKGCMIPHRSWTTYAAHMAACFGMSASDRYLAFLPFFHVAGFGTALSQLLLGGTVVTMPLAEPKHFRQLVAKHQLSVMFLIPGLSSAFLAEALSAPDNVRSLRAFICGAGFEKGELIRGIEEKLGATYFGIYGQTESGGKTTWASGAQLRNDPASYGHVMPFYDYRLLDDNDIDVAPGEIGELCLRGPGIMLGYWNQPEATAESLRNGWHHTGDLFVRQPDGQIKMVDRRKYLIKSGGENVYPQEVEQVLLAHPAVAEAAVIGVPDARWGEAVKACIVLRADAPADRQELADWVGRHIAGYKKPRYIEFVSAIARNASGKILKDALLALPTTPDQQV